MTRRARFGDVFEVATPCGYAYLQYVQRHPQEGDLVRVLDGLFPEPQTSLKELVDGTDQYAVFYPVGVDHRRGLAKLVANYPVPQRWQALPRTRLAVLGDGRNGWLLYDGTKETGRTRTLSAEQLTWPVSEVWNHAMLVSRIASQWSWPDADGAIPYPIPPRRKPCHDIGVPWPPDLADEEPVSEFFVSFKAYDDAERAKAELAFDRGLSINLRPAPDDDTWLLRVTAQPGNEDELEDRIVALAGQYHGDYDGHRRPL